MENDPDRVALPGADTADTMSQIDAIGTARPLHRTLMDGECHGISLSQRNDLRSRLHAWTLLGQHKFAAREVPRWFRQQYRNLYRENMFAIKILVQAVVIAR